MNRLELHEILCDILGSRNVYYQPPDGVKMNFPAIVYSDNEKGVVYADDGKYLTHDSYEIIVMHKSPDYDVANEISKLPMTRCGKRYMSDNIYHDPITLYI